MKKATTWLLIANTNSALIYDISSHEHLPKLKDHLVKAFDFPEGKLKSSELGNDEPGRYHTMGAPGSAYSPDTNPHQVELERFSRLIGDYLLAENLAHHYEQLIVCAEPHFLGILDTHFPKHVKDSVKIKINKDYIPMIHNSFNEFVERLRENLL